MSLLKKKKTNVRDYDCYNTRKFTTFGVILLYTPYIVLLLPFFFIFGRQLFRYGVARPPPPRFFFLSIFFERGLTRSAFILFSFFHFVIFIPFFFSKINFKRFLELTQRVLHNNVRTYCVCVLSQPSPPLFRVQ